MKKYFCEKYLQVTFQWAIYFFNKKWGKNFLMFIYCRNMIFRQTLIWGKIAKIMLCSIRPSIFVILLCFFQFREQIKEVWVWKNILQRVCCYGLRNVTPLKGKCKTHGFILFLPISFRWNIVSKIFQGTC